ATPSPLSLHDALPIYVKDAEAAAKLVGLQLVTVRARAPEEFTAAFDAIVKAHAGAVDIWGDPVFGRHRTALIDHAMRSRLPTMRSEEHTSELQSRFDL